MSQIKNEDRVASALETLRSMRSYLGLGGLRRRSNVNNPHSLGEFLDARSSLVAQTTLFGYLKTRMGTRYPSLFEDDTFLVSINQAKWQVWLACLSDLSVFAGGLVARRSQRPDDAVSSLMESAIEDILAATGVPEDAGPEFTQSAEVLRGRITNTQWSAVRDDDTPFSTSPDALVFWAPVIEEFKQTDEEIIRNSVRYRWQEVRRELRRKLDAEALIEVFERSRPALAPRSI